jgi:addiction module RelB/DinJ family antitoxin
MASLAKRMETISLTPKIVVFTHCLPTIFLSLLSEPVWDTMLSMARTAMIRARTETELKSDVEGIFTELGLSATEAINLFYRQVRLNKGLPFEVRRLAVITTMSEAKCRQRA